MSGRGARRRAWGRRAFLGALAAAALGGCRRRLPPTRALSDAAVRRAARWAG